ncbi:MAG: DUF2279 domain-containing protein [Bacteroidetes bacterium]|nr:MAG: DUF2279 domain-containing protein [Bacteroidota bacterium]
MRPYLFIIVIGLLPLRAQEPHGNGPGRKEIVAGVLIGYSALSFYTEYQWWWNGNYHAFRYEDDGFLHNYSLGVDKAGHFYTSYLYFTAVSELMTWAEFDESTVLAVAVAMPLTHALSIEIGDGFSTYAFSGVDLAANVLGIGFGALQRRVPFFRNFTVKWSYYPSGIVPFDRHYRLTDDYDGHIYWLSWNVHGTLPEEWKSYWPTFLNIAVGYGGRNISGRPAYIGAPIAPPGPPERKFAVALDLNLRSFEMEPGALRALRNTADLFKLPAPGMRSTGASSPELSPLLLN